MRTITGEPISATLGVAVGGEYTESENSFFLNILIGLCVLTIAFIITAQTYDVFTGMLFLGAATIAFLSYALIPRVKGFPHDPNRPLDIP
tara:strand:+ start:124 stop:393 length:270 start_codon:yes stop_codon:yes gene_type:complete